MLPGAFVLAYRCRNVIHAMNVNSSLYSRGEKTDGERNAAVTLMLTEKAL